MKILIYDKLGTEIHIIRERRSNQLISLREDAQKILLTNLVENVVLI